MSEIEDRAGGAGRQACAGLPGASWWPTPRRPCSCSKTPLSGLLLCLWATWCGPDGHRTGYHSRPSDAALRRGGRRAAAPGRRSTTATRHRALQRAVRIEWDAMDEWLEEDEPVYTHPGARTRAWTSLASSRHVVVELDGTARDRTSRGPLRDRLPPRYYLPLTTCRFGALAAVPR